MRFVLEKLKELLAEFVVGIEHDVLYFLKLRKIQAKLNFILIGLNLLANGVRAERQGRIALMMKGLPIHQKRCELQLLDFSVLHLIFYLEDGGVHGKFSYAVHMEANIHVLAVVLEDYFVILDEDVNEILDGHGITGVDEGPIWYGLIGKDGAFDLENAVTRRYEKLVIVPLVLLLELHKSIIKIDFTIIRKYL